MLKNLLATPRAFWIVWIWTPLKDYLSDLIGTASCCEQPDWTWTEGHGFDIRTCQNCKNSRTFYRTL